MLTWAESSDESFLTVLIFDETFTFPFGNDEEIIGGFTLLDLDLFRLAHDELNFDNHIVFDLWVEGEDEILFQLLREDEACYLFL